MKEPDAVYRCPCGQVYDDQIAYERHLAATHNRLRDTLPTLLTALEGSEPPT